MNVLTLADALAARYASGTLSAPAGYPAIRLATARVPNVISAFPAVLVFPPDGEMEIVSTSGMATYHLDFMVVFHLGQYSGDLARDTAALDSWLGPLLQATFGAMKLGVTGVMKSYPMTWTLAVAKYGEEEFDTWRIKVRIDFEEAQVYTP